MVALLLVSAPDRPSRSRWMSCLEVAVDVFGYVEPPLKMSSLSRRALSVAKYESCRVEIVSGHLEGAADVCLQSAAAPRL